MTDLDKAVEHILDAYKAAVHSKDAAAFIRLYDPKVRVFDAWGVWSYEGAESWQRAVEAWFTSLGTERVQVSFEDLQCTGTPALAIVSVVVRYAGVSAEGAPLRAMHNRLSWGLKLSGHVLRIVHEHTSVPMGFEDTKGILVRQAAGQR